MKRPQVQILSPRPCFRRPEALTRVGEGLSCCQYRCKIPHVPQQIRTLTCSSNGFPQPAQRFAGTKRPRARTCDPDQSSRRSWLRRGLEGELEGAPPSLRCASRVAIGLAFGPVSYTHLRAHETDSYLVCRLLLEKKKKK